MRAGLIVLARFLLSAVFLAAGINKLFHWHETEQMLMDVLSNWQSHLSFSETAQHVFSSLILFAPLLLFVAVAMELIGGLLLLLGIREKFAAGLLLIMLIPTTILFHQFWFVEAAAKELQQGLFLRNLAIMGGLIMVTLFGAKSLQKKDNGIQGGSFKFQ